MSEIKRTDKEIRDVWFGHGKYGPTQWMVIVYFFFEGREYLVTVDGKSRQQACDEAARIQGEHIIGCSLPFRAQYPLCVPSTMIELDSMRFN